MLSPLTHHHGFAVEYTGNQVADLYGKPAFEFRWTEGWRKGYVGWTYRPPAED